ncbi:MAG: hypothetical protein SFY32_11185 [Bacteroidota bacterium]|nr:hypothetical protein [Bacteroidota bacterium]
MKLNIFSKERRKKPEKKEKRKPFLSEACRDCQGFLEKYYPTKEGWRFFQKPEGLDLYNPAEPNYFCFHFLFFASPSSGVIVAVG